MNFNSFYYGRRVATPISVMGLRWTYVASCVRSGLLTKGIVANLNADDI